MSDNIIHPVYSVGRCEFQYPEIPSYQEILSLVNNVKSQEFKESISAALHLIADSIKNFKNRKIIVYKVSPFHDTNPVIFKDLKEALHCAEDLIMCSEVGDDITIIIDEMTLEEFNNLPEHQGW